MATHTCPWPHCGKAFGSRWLLKRHYLIHTGSKTHVCDICGKGFLDRALLNRHKGTHESNPSFVCTHEGCAKTFKRKVALAHHLRTHVDPDVFVCAIDGCRQKYATPSSLRIHRSIVHGTSDNLEEVMLRAQIDGIAVQTSYVQTLCQQLDDSTAREREGVQNVQQRVAAQRAYIQGIRDENTMLRLFVDKS